MSEENKEVVKETVVQRRPLWVASWVVLIALVILAIVLEVNYLWTHPQTRVQAAATTAAVAPTPNVTATSVAKILAENASLKAQLAKAAAAPTNAPTVQATATAVAPTPTTVSTDFSANFSSGAVVPTSAPTQVSVQAANATPTNPGENPQMASAITTTITTTDGLHSLCDAAGVQDIVVQTNVQQAAVRISTEPCTWQVNFGMKYSEVLTLPVGYIGTLHLVGQEFAKVFVGDGKAYKVHRATLRYIAGFQADDAVHQTPPCELAKKEYLNGMDQIYPFAVVTGNFSCPELNSQYPGTDGSKASNIKPNTSQTTAQCPNFGGFATTRISPTECKLKWDEKRGVLTGQIPTGWKAIFWDGKATQTATSGSITTGEATFAIQ